MTICLVDIMDYRAFYHEPSFIQINKFGSLKIDSRKPLDVDILDVNRVQKLIQHRKSFTLDMNKKCEWELRRTLKTCLWLIFYGWF